MRTRSARGPRVTIACGILIAVIHLTLAVAGVMTSAQWISGVAVGLVVAGIGNHLRIFGGR